MVINLFVYLREMLEQSSVELENTIANLEEKNNTVEDEGNLLLDCDLMVNSSDSYCRYSSLANSAVMSFSWTLKLSKDAVTVRQFFLQLEKGNI